ncbi:uncharacterized protein LOC111685851 [Lucilia cuprina]|uniref:uncharacterized protein LOC111685851 n=1 Tax=Lucilia cuprina TaxID=7375 RepID=UPI001F054B40|nr:uncharacterized protein LOC111685851 [Lucilia cuprina]
MYFISFTVCLLFAHVAVGKPAVQHDDHFKDFDLCKLKTIYTTLAPNEKDHTLAPTVQLMKLIVFDLQDLALTYARNAKDISDQLIKESLFSSNQSLEVQKFKHEIEEFQKKYNSCADMNELFDIVDIYSNTTSEYYEMEANGTLSADGKLIQNVLKKYSPKDMDEEFEEKFLNTFAVNFSRKIEELKGKLEAEEGGMGEKILQWWAKVKTLNTVEEKMNAFKEYMKLYGFEDE